MHRRRPPPAQEPSNDGRILPSKREPDTARPTASYRRKARTSALVATPTREEGRAAIRATRRVDKRCKYNLDQRLRKAHASGAHRDEAKCPHINTALRELRRQHIPKKRRYKRTAARCYRLEGPHKLRSTRTGALRTRPPLKAGGPLPGRCERRRSENLAWARSFNCNRRQGAK